MPPSHSLGSATVNHSPPSGRRKLGIKFGLAAIAAGAMASASPPRPARLGTDTLALTHVTVIDGTGQPPRRDMTVIVSDGRIAALGPSADTPVPPKAQLVDSAGGFVIPGLWDMHVHLDLGDVDRMLPLFVANGVVGVRDMAGVADRVFRWRAEVEQDRRLGPQIVALAADSLRFAARAAELWNVRLCSRGG